MTRNETISIVGGCGHVGLPLGIVIAEAGFQTHLYDLNSKLIEQVNHGHMPHLEEEGPERLAKVIDSGHLKATKDPAVLKNSTIIIVAIGTPVDEYLNPRLQDLISAMQGLRQYLQSPDQMVVFRSTLAPGTLRVIADQLQEWGCPVTVAYCPERIVQGKALTELKGLPQLISGLQPAAVERCRALFLALTDMEPIVLDPIEAELAKLFCNAWRYINFAISNQFYQIAEEAGASFARIHEAAVSGYPRMKEFARAGLTAGPCLLKDTMQLASFSRNTFFLGHSAMLVNEGLPAFLLSQLKSAMDGCIRGKTIGLLGMAFKPDNDDTRESLSFKIRKLLLNQGAQVLCHDPFVDQSYFPNIRFVELDEALDADGLMIGVPHSVYRKLRFPNPKVVIDVWNSISP